MDPETLIDILKDTVLTLEIMIVAGFALIIISVAQPSRIPILNISLKLSRNRLIILAMIGCILILGGFSELILENNSAPKFVYVQINPNPATAYSNGTDVNIDVLAEDPDTNNKIQKLLYKSLFSKITPLQYKFSYRCLITNNLTTPIKGPDESPNCTFPVYPNYGDKVTIEINATDCPLGDTNAKTCTTISSLYIKRI